MTRKTDPPHELIPQLKPPSPGKGWQILINNPLIWTSLLPRVVTQFFPLSTPFDRWDFSHLMQSHPKPGELLIKMRKR